MTPAPTASTTARPPPPRVTNGQGVEVVYDGLGAGAIDKSLLAIEGVGEALMRIASGNTTGKLLIHV